MSAAVWWVVHHTCVLSMQYARAQRWNHGEVVDALSVKAVLFGPSHKLVTLLVILCLLVVHATACLDLDATCERWRDEPSRWVVKGPCVISLLSQPNMQMTRACSTRPSKSKWAYLNLFCTLIKNSGALWQRGPRLICTPDFNQSAKKMWAPQTTSPWM